MTDTQIAPQETRVEKLEDALVAHDEATEAARLAYIEAVHDNLPPDEVKPLRRSWDAARAARNARETIILSQKT